MTQGADRLLTPLKGVNWWLLAVFGAAVASYALVMMPFMLGAMAVGGLFVLITAMATYVWPERVVRLSFFLLMIGSTSFRVRDEYATLQGVADVQVLFQLGVSGLVFVVAAVAMLTDAFPKTRILLAECLLGAFGVFAFVSLVWSSTPTLTAVRAVQVLIVIFFAGVAVRLLGPSKALEALFVATIIYVLLGTTARLLTGAGYQKIDLQGAVRFTWFYVHPIIAGTYAAAGALYLVARSLYDGHRALLWRAVPWLLFFVMVAVALATRSRGPVFACVGGLGILLIRRYSRPWITAVGVPIVFALVLAVSAAIPVAQNWLGSGEGAESAAADFLLRGEGLQGLTDLNGRVSLWVDLTPLFLKHPLIGSGFLASREFILQYRSWASEAHNSLVQSLLDLGVVGTMLLWLPIALTFMPFRDGRTSSPTSQRARAIGIALMVFVVLNSVTTASFAGAPGYESLLAFTCVIAVAANRRGDQR